MYGLPEQEVEIPEEYRGKGWGWFSGGKDSLLACLEMESEGRLLGVLFIDTTIGTKTTRDYVKDFCKKRGWPLEVIRAKGTYDEFVLKYGFPHAGWHTKIMLELKAHAINDWAMDYRKQRGVYRTRSKDRPLCFSGIRKLESDTRFDTGELFTEKYGCYVYSPLFWVSTSERDRMLSEKYGLTKEDFNPDYDTYGRSWDCACGAYAEKEEVSLLKMFAPEIAEHLQWLEEQCRLKGLPEKYCHWGNHEGFIEKVKNRRTLNQIFCRTPCGIPRS